MKITTGYQNKALVYLGLLAISAGSLWGQGTIVPHSIAFGQPAAAPPGTYLMANAYPSGPNGGFFVLNLATISAGNYRLSYYGIAELYSVHAASFGAAFTPAYVAGNAPLLNNNNMPGSYQFSLGLGQSMLFGYWDDAVSGGSPLPGGTPNIPDSTDAYGWFRLTRQVSGVVIADSATAMGGGILAGTYTAVPEPTSLALGLVGVGFVGIIYRRRHCAGHFTH